MILVNCRDYNGHKDVKFMMSPDDFHLADPNYQVLDPAAVYSRRHKTLTSSRGTFTVCADWSVREAV